jgi:nucleoside-specific outer membrane channel protein Tsx
MKEKEEKKEREREKKTHSNHVQQLVEIYWHETRSLRSFCDNGV